MRVHRESSLRYDAGNLPMSRGAVLSLRSLRHLPIAAIDLNLGVEAFDGGDSPQAKTLKIGELQSAEYTRDIPDRIRSSIAVGRSIRKLTDSDAVEDHEYQPVILQ